MIHKLAIPSGRSSMVLPAALTLLLVLLVIGTGGPSISADGWNYIGTAKNLRAGMGFRPVGGMDTAHFPPGMALVLVTLRYLGWSWTAGALLVNWASWLASLVAVDRLYGLFNGRDGGWRLALLLWVAVAGAMTSLIASVQSEPLYIALSLWGLVLAERWLREGSVPDGLAVGVLGAGAIAVRYVGVCFVLAVVLRVISQGGSLRRLASRLLVPAFAALPVVIWYLVHQSTTRSDAPSLSGSALSLSDVVHSLGALGSVLFGGLPYSDNDTIVAGSIDPLIRASFALAGGLAVLLGLIACWRWYRDEDRVGSQPREVQSSGWSIVLTYIVIYVVLMVFWRIPAGYTILARYWLPVVIPVMAMMAAAGSQWVPPKRVVGLLPAMGALFVSANLAVSVVYLVH